MQGHTVSMAQRQFRIGDLADELKVKKFVIRFWEQEFGLSATRSEGGHRFYTAADLQTFQIIKDLLHHQGYTIEGARKQLPLLLKERAKAPAEKVIEAAPAVAPAATASEPVLVEAIAGAHVDEQAAVRTCHHEAVHVPVAVPCTTCEQHSRHLAMVREELETLLARHR